MLEVHVPDSVKHFSKHLFATFLGLLMALGLEQWREHRHRQHMVAQTRELIVQEIEQNQKELREELETMKKGLQPMLHLTRALEAKLGERPARERLALPTQNVSWTMATLRSGSWDTGQATQAFASMDPWRVGRIATAFAAQRDLLGHHALLIQKAPLLARLQSLLTAPGALDRTPPARLRDMLESLREFLSTAQLVHASGRDLDKAYTEALQACRP